MHANCKGECGKEGCAKKGCGMKIVAKVLIIIGGLNWGLIGLGMLLGKADAWNFVHMIFRSMPSIEAIIYVLVGVAAVMKVFGCKCHKCMGGACTAGDKMADKGESMM